VYIQTRRYGEIKLLQVQDRQEKEGGCDGGCRVNLILPTALFISESIKNVDQKILISF